MILCFRINSGDTALQKHLRHASGKALYTSTQNELLQISADMVRENILQRISSSPCWALMADETTDRANREQLAIVVRYVDKHGDQFVVREDPVQILELMASIRRGLMKGGTSESDGNSGPLELRMSGENIASVVIEQLRRMQLEPEKLVAQCYDGAASMSSERVGTASHVKAMLKVLIIFTVRIMV